MAGKPIILSVDDTQSILNIVSKLGQKAGFDVAEALDGKLGLAKLADLKAAGTPPKLIISDINMPVMDGLTFIREVRKTDRVTPILVLTTVASKEDMKKGKEAGANGWVQKPVQMAVFLDTIKKMTSV